ncbi:MAG: hypothetical protein ACE5IZ_04835 [Dehalococcoidia bacterium]
MGAHVHSILRISPADTRNVYIFIFAIPPWDDVYDWLEEKFVRISSALGTEGLLVMGDPGELEPELVEAYSHLDESIRQLPGLRSSGLIVTNVNPHDAVGRQRKPEDQVLFIPIRTETRRQISRIVDDIIKAAKAGDLSLVKSLSQPLTPSDTKTLLGIIAENALLQPNVSGLGYDFKNLLRQLVERSRQRKQKYN